MDDDFDFPTAASNGMDFDDEMDAGNDVDLPELDPVLKVGEERAIDKNGLRKKLLKEGEGWENPNSGDEVEGTFCGLDCSVYFPLVF